MPTNDDRKNIIKVIRNLFFKGYDLGFIKPNSQKVSLKGIVQTAEVDQIAATVAKLVMNGFAPELEVTLMRTDIDFVAGVVLSGMTGYKYGTDGPLYGFGNPEIDGELLQGELLSIPKNNPIGKRTNSIRMIAVPSPETIELLMGKGNFQELPLKFIAMPDLDAGILFEMMQMGNLDAEDLAPLSVFLQTNMPFARGAKTLTTIGMSVSSQQQVQIYRFDGTPSGVVADLAADITATGTTITYENASQNNPFVVGQVVQFDGARDLGLVVSVTPTTLTSGSIEVVRDAYGSTGAIRTAGDEIAILKNVYRVNFTQQGSITSSQPSRVKVGNVAGALDLNQKALLSHAGTAGAANIVADVGGILSPALVATAA